MVRLWTIAADSTRDCGQLGVMVIRETMLHATCVAVQGRGLLILGPSGSGKSALALDLMAVEADLVSDDQTCVLRRGGTLFARPPDTIAGRIEARGIGILRAKNLPQAQIHCAIDLGQEEQMRLPPQRVHEILGIFVPLVLGPYRPQLYAAMRQMMWKGRCA